MARVRGIKQPHPLGSVAARAGVVQPLTAASGGVTGGGGVKISALPEAGAANLTDQLEVNQDGTTRRVTLTQVTAATMAVRVMLPVTGTVAPLQAGDASKLFILPAAASGLVTIPLPPAADVPPGWSIDLLAIPGSGGGDNGVGIRLDAADGDVINDGSDDSAPGGRFRSRSDGSALRLLRVLTGAHAWYVVHKIGNWN